MCILLPYKSPLLSTPPSINMPPVSDISRIGNRWEGMSGSGKVYLTELKVSGQRRQWHPTLVLLPGNSHGQRSLVGCSPWGREELDPTVQLHFHFSLSCIGEGNGNPLQCSCLENPRDGGAWWAAVYGVAQSRTQLGQLGSGSSSSTIHRLRKLGSILQLKIAWVSCITLQNKQCFETKILNSWKNDFFWSYKEKNYIHLIF